MYSIVTWLVKCFLFSLLFLLQFPDYMRCRQPDYCKSICEVCVAESVSCYIEGFSEVPKYISNTTTSFTILNQKFAKDFLISENFTKISPPFVFLIKLYIRNSNIRIIHRNTFSSMKTLQNLDLSSTSELTIKPRAFSGLVLKILMLNNILRLNLDSGAFDNLKVEALHMTDSSLTMLSFNLLEPILPFLKKLFLNKNKLKILDEKFQMSFKSLNKLDLQNNPFSCSCSMKWLIKVYHYRSKMGKLIQSAFEKIQSSPTCYEPIYLRGESIHKISLSQLNCESPSLTQMKIDFLSPSETELTCQASHPIPSARLSVKWYRNIIQHISNIAQNLLNHQSTRDTVIVQRHNSIDSYDCIAQNINGNVTATVKISWPVLNEAKISTHPNINRFPDSNLNNWVDSASSNNNYFFRKRFTLLEMGGAVIGTFSVTFILFFLGKYFYFRRKTNRKTIMQHNGYTTYDAAVYSDSQTYDIPGNSYPQTMLLHMPRLTNSSTPDHFLDFKTQKKLYKTP